MVPPVVRYWHTNFLPSNLLQMGFQIQVKGVNGIVNYRDGVFLDGIQSRRRIHQGPRRVIREMGSS